MNENTQPVVKDSLVLTPRQIAFALRMYRQRLGLTQVQVAQKAGILPKTVSLMENTPERASLESLLKLLSALRLELLIHAKELHSDLPDQDW